jgi:uncharacterized membrane protein YfcA
MYILAMFLAVLVGVSLGLIGSGGSVLTLPIMVYLLHFEPVLATSYSLFIVGLAALIGGIQYAVKGLVKPRIVIIFGIPSIITVYLTRAFLLPAIPDELFQFGPFHVTKALLLMLLFAVIMFVAAISMIRKKKIRDAESEVQTNTSISVKVVLIEGVVVGLLTGLVGAGGGFLIIPALVIFCGVEMKTAVGTSLFIIAAKSLIGFTGDLQADVQLDWMLLISFSLATIVGIVIGFSLVNKFSADRLKSLFGWFVLLFSIFIIIKELLSIQ